MSSTSGSIPSSTGSQPQFFGHPVGLSALFFTELWERMSYYGMRALLVLFMTATVAEGGMAFDDVTATAIYGIYTAAVYMVALPGGWVADRLLGQQRSIYYGAMIIAAGHFTMAMPVTGWVSDYFGFFVGMLLIVVGTGLLKPNISAIVGELYPEGGARRDAGFSIFYMGINLGAILGPAVCSSLGENVNWHYGFGAAGVGMLLGIIFFRRMRGYLGDAGIAPSLPTTRPAMAWSGIGTFLGAILLVTALALTGKIIINPAMLAKGTSVAIVSLSALFFLYVLLFGGLDAAQKKRVVVIAALFLGAALFWSGFEQAGSSLNLFAKRYTERQMFGIQVPAGLFQIINPLYIVLFAPFFAALWVNLARRNLEPSLSVKFALGFFQLALGFLVMYFASKYVVQGQQVLPTWLMLTYLFHTTGELCLSPIGLSAVTKLAPKKFRSQMMGTWFMGASLGNLIAGLAAGNFGRDDVAQMPEMYMKIVIFGIVFGLLFLVMKGPLTRMAGNFHSSAPTPDRDGP